MAKWHNKWKPGRYAKYGPTHRYGVGGLARASGAALGFIRANIPGAIAGYEVGKDLYNWKYPQQYRKFKLGSNRGRNNSGPYWRPPPGHKVGSVPRTGPVLGSNPSVPRAQPATPNGRKFVGRTVGKKFKGRGHGLKGHIKRRIKF